MTNKLVKKLSVFVVTFLMGFGTVFAGEVDYGAAGALDKDEYTLEDMLVYALQDEYLARAEYEKIMEVFGEQRPFSNIMNAEEQHIELLKPLFEKYGIDAPKDTSGEYVEVPDSLTEAYETGVQAEIYNIEMYERFLEQDIPQDVKDVFEILKEGSENHLEAFTRNLEKYDGTGKNIGTGKFQRKSQMSQGLWRGKQ